MATLKAVEWWCSECGQAHVRIVKKCSRCKVAFTAEALKPSHNSDYATALRVWREWDEMPFDGWPEDIPDFDEYCKERLNSEEPNCA